MIYPRSTSSLPLIPLPRVRVGPDGADRCVTILGGLGADVGFLIIIDFDVEEIAGERS